MRLSPTHGPHVSPPFSPASQLLDMLLSLAATEDGAVSACSEREGAARDWDR